MKMHFSDGFEYQTITAGNGHFAESTVRSSYIKPKILGIMSSSSSETLHLASSYAAVEGEITIHVRYLCCPHQITVTAHAETDNTLRLSLSGLLEDSAREIIGYLPT